jgi:hypothetical protein
MKCANCDRDAFYIYQITKQKEVLYCGKHLPTFLEPRRKAGLLKTTEQLKVEIDSAIAILSTDEPTQEVQAPKPKRKKKADEEPSEE